MRFGFMAETRTAQLLLCMKESVNSRLTFAPDAATKA